MKKHIDRILISILWLLAACLATSFLFNCMFSFDIFSARHWQYLAYMQAAQTPIRTTFYVWLVICIAVTVIGLCMAIWPGSLLMLRRLNIRRAVQSDAATKNAMDQIQTTMAQNAPTAPSLSDAPNATTIASTPVAIGAQPATDAQTKKRPARPNGVRAPAMNTPTSSGTPVMTPGATPPPQAAPEMTLRAPTTPDPQTEIITEIQDIFTAAGYTPKPTTRIGPLRQAIVAIGTDEQLWVGGIGVDQQTVLAAMERLLRIFTDTLDGSVEIGISGFIVAPLGDVDHLDIAAFKTPDDMRAYMEQNPNTAPTDTGAQENFDAYSGYIDVVLKHADNI